jgi:hypothetical protein
MVLANQKAPRPPAAGACGPRGSACGQGIRQTTDAPQFEQMVWRYSCARPPCNSSSARFLSITPVSPPSARLVRTAADGWRRTRAYPAHPARGAAASAPFDGEGGEARRAGQSRPEQARAGQSGQRISQRLGEDVRQPLTAGSLQRHIRSDGTSAARRSSSLLLSCDEPAAAGRTLTAGISKLF